MRTRPPLQRLLLGLFGLWFSLIMAEPAWLVGCPMHDHGGHQQSSAAHDHHSGQHTDSDAASDADGSRETGEPNLCDCRNCCAGAVAFTFPAFALIATTARIRYTYTLPDIVFGSAFRVTRFAFALPFSNGPPTTAPIYS